MTRWAASATLLLSVAHGECFVPKALAPYPRLTPHSRSSNLRATQHSLPEKVAPQAAVAAEQPGLASPFAAVLLGFVLPFFACSPAHAAAVVPRAIPGALAAYCHYGALLVMVGALVFERLTIKTNMSEGEFDLLVKADGAYLLSTAVLFVSGYFRTMLYGKGWIFYAHEPIFWLKLALFSVLAASSLFVTVTLAQRAVAKHLADGDAVPPFSEKCVFRMHQVVNAELHSIASIPLAATLMARGVGYTEEMPWQAGAAVVAATAAGFGWKYVMEAVQWSEE